MIRKLLPFLLPFLGALAFGQTVPKNVTKAGGTNIIAEDLVFDSRILTLNTAIVFGDGVRQTFNPNGTAAGLNVGAHTADPSTLVNGDIWYNSTSNEVKVRANGTTTALGAGGGSGDVVGPASSIDTRLALFDLTTGKLLKQSTALTESGGTITSNTAIALVAGGTNQNVTLTPSGTGVIVPSAAFSFPDGVRQTFNPNGTNAGINVGSQAGDPSAPSDGDLWYDSTANELTARINGSNVALGAGGGGAVATDVIWDAKGDLAVGTGANTAAKLTIGANGTIPIADSSQTTGIRWDTVAGTGDVVGAASSTDNALARFDSTTGKIIQNSNVTLADSGTALVFSAAAGLTASGTNQSVTLTPTGTGTVVSAGLHSVSFSSSSSSPQGLTVQNTDSAGRSTVFVLNDNGVGGNIGTYGSAFTSAAYRNQLAIGADNSLFFNSDANTASGGSNTVQFITGGYNNSASLTIAGGNPGAVTVAGTLNVSGVIVPTSTITFADGVRQTFNPNSTTPGINVGSHTADPSSPSNGDLWYDSTANELTARINGANVALGSGGGTSGTKTLARFTALDAQPPASNYAQFRTRNSIAVLDYDASTDESTVWAGIIPEGADFTTGIAVRIHWIATSATSGDVIWNSSFERSNTDLDSDSFATAVAGSAATTNGTSGIVTVTTINHSGSEIDGLTAGDLFRFKLLRDADNGSDNMTGDAEVVAVELRQR